ncbi:MAG TPA: TadE/TadG family type IV pilus assembly protein [Candidatus Dormibacteraeota bacterium]
MNSDSPQQTAGPRGRSRGQSLTEFALCLPIILLAVGLTIDFARVYYYDLAIRDASFAAARYAGMNPSDDAGIKAAAVNAAPSGVLTAAGVTITAPVVTGCDGSRVSGCPLQISVSYVFSPITPVITALTGTGITLSRNQTDIIK